RGRWYSPVLSDAGGTANLDFHVILAQKPVAFPVPAAGNAGQLNAYQALSRYIAGTTCKDSTSSCTNDLRPNYSDANSSDWLSRLGTLCGPDYSKCDQTALSSYTTGLGTFTPTDLSNVAQQLSTEFGYVGKVQTFNQQLSGLLTDSQLNQA